MRRGTDSRRKEIYKIIVSQGSAKVGELATVLHVTNS